MNRKTRNTYARFKIYLGHFFSVFNLKSDSAVKTIAGLSFLVYESLVVTLLVKELSASSIRATDRSIQLIGLSFLPILLLLAWHALTNLTRSRDVTAQINTLKIEIKKDVKNEVTTDLIERVTATTESTLYSLASLIII